MPYGLTSTGFSKKSLAVIKSEIETALRASSAFGSDIDTSAESMLGQIVSTFAAKVSELWELGEATYSARNPRAASFNALDIVCGLTGIQRLPATKGTVTLRMNVAALTTIPAGAIARVAGQPDNRWITTEAAINATGSAANVSVAAIAETAGRYLANAGTITEIAVPVSGWNSVTNVLDAEPGRDMESDTALRVRRARAIRAGGSSPLDAIRAALFAVEDVQQVNVFENTSDYTVNSMAPHSVLAVVTGGTDQAVGEALFAAKAAGIATNGNTTVTIVDDGGVSHTVTFKRPTTVNVYVKVTIERDSATYGGDDAVKTAITDLGDALLAGDNVRQAAISRAVMGVTGVADVTEVLIGRAGGASRVNANLSIALDERADLDSSRIQIVAGDITP